MSQKEIKPSLHPLGESGEHGDVDPQRPQSPDGTQDKSFVTDDSEQQRRVASFKRLARILIIAGCVIVGICATLFYRTGAWQALAAAGLVVLGFVGLIIARAFRAGTIRMRLLIAFVVMVLLPATATSAASIVFGLQNGRQQVIDKLESVATLKEAELDTWVQSLLIELDTALVGEEAMQCVSVLLGEGSPDSTPYQDAYNELKGRLQQIAALSGRFEELFIMDGKGQVVLSTDAEQEGNNRRSQAYFREGLNGHYVYPPFYSPSLGRAFLFAARPVVDQQGNTLGVLAGRPTMETLSDVMRERSGLGDTGETYVVNASRALLTELRTGEYGIYLRSKGVTAAADDHQDGFGFYENDRGEPVVGVYRWLPELQVALVAEQNQSEAFRTMSTMMGINLGVALAAVLGAVLASLFITQGIALPLANLADTAGQIAAGDLELDAKVTREDEIGALARAFNSMTAQLRGLIGNLEQRVAERTQALAYRNVQLATASKVSEAVGSILDLDELEQQVVELIRQRFNYYYVGLFLVQENNEWTKEHEQWAVLRAGTGEAGQAMLQAGHKLAVGGNSMVGNCITEARACIALDTGEEIHRFENPLLPKTRSEMALPLIARGKVIGALSVQSERERAFSEEDISVLQTMTAQVANAIANAQLYEQAQQELIERKQVEKALRESQERLRTLLDSTPTGIVVIDAETHTIVDANPVAVEMFGAPKEEIVGSVCHKHICPAEKGRCPITDLGQTVDKSERVLLRTRGRQVPILKTVASVMLDGREHLLETFIDITDRKQAETERERLLTAEREQRLLADTLREVALTLTSQISHKAVLDEILRQVQRIVPYRTAHFVLLEDGILRSACWQGYETLGGENYIANLVQNLDDLPLDAEAIRLRTPRVVPDTRKESMWVMFDQTAWIRSHLTMPICLRDRVLGLLRLDSDIPGQFSNADARNLQPLANAAAVALESTQLYEDAKRHADEMETLYNTSLHLGTIGNLDDLFHEAIHQAVTLLQAGDGGLYLYDPATDELEWVASYGPAQAKIGTRLQRGEGLSGQVMQERRPMVIDDYRTWAGQDSRFGDLPFSAVVAVPLLWQDKLVGVLNVADDKERRSFTQDDVRLLTLLGQQVAAAIETTRLFQETEANLKEITRLHRRYLQEQWEEFLSQEEAQERVSYLFDQRQVQPAKNLWRPEIGMAMAEGQTLALTAKDDEWNKDGTQSALVVPLQLRDQIIGALDFFETGQDRQWSEDDITLVETVADQVALAIENARAYEELQRTAAQLRELDILRSQFLANMSHELRTPLNSIIGFSRVLLKGIDGPLTELQQTDLTSIYNNGQNLLGLINDVLDMSRIEAGKMELVFEPVDLKPVIDGVMSTAIGLVKDKPVELVKEIADDLPIIRADTTRIRQVILNLVSNAAKFTEEGHITVRAWADNEHVTVSVTDSGIGIPEEHWDTVFQEFRQVDGSATRRAGGTGLGLPISRHFVELHGGQIWVESEEGVGSTFSFTIPIHGPGYVEDPELAALEIDPDRPLVLAVESDEGMITFYRRYLDHHGYQIVGLADPDRVKLWVRELSPFAVLMDVMMPETDGWKLLENLKTSRETAHVPVIICSIANEEARALSLGAAAFLNKPVLEQDLVQAMATAAELQST